MEIEKVVTLNKMIHRIKSTNVTCEIELTEDFYGFNIKSFYLKSTHNFLLEFY